MKLTILIAAHKPYELPEDPAYLPVFVGAQGKATPVKAWQRDDGGEQISAKNPTFCELTGHYWMWKNVDADAYGLCHYRRYFGRRLGEKRGRIWSGADIEKRLEGCDILLPVKRHYWIETNYSQYAHAHHEQDLILTRQILCERFPEDAQGWDAVMARRSGHRFNMFVMRRELFEEYSAWLFDILFELEKRLDISSYSAKDRRVFGYVSERLMDVWLYRRRLRVRECPVVCMESQHWGKKIASFIARKLKARG